jgi:hypothetical protein
MKRFARGAVALASVALLGAVAATSSPAAAPTPVLGQSAVMSTVHGHVSIERAGSSKFAALGSAPTLVPFGAIVNADHGRVQVTIATATAGSTSTALFYSGEFEIAQPSSGIAELTLNGPLKPCTTAGARIASSHKSVARPKPSKSRSLWGDGGSGQFTTKGNYAAATVLGTVWLTTDSCTGTVVGVAEGTVSVTNLVTNAASSVTTGQALTVQSSGTSSVAPFSGAAANGYAITIAASRNKVKLGDPYSLTATGTAGASATAYIYENVGTPCDATLASEQADKVAHLFKSTTLSAAGPFSLTAPALAQHTGTKYYCGYLTNPAAYAQVVVKVSP